MNLAEQYIAAKYGNPTRADLIALRKKVGAEIETIKDEKSDVFRRYTGVHGRFQESQLDVLDIREQKASAMFDNISVMIGRACA
ncbi:MAG: hypothetical protein Unbinned3138contig1000_17 [Prokaryotic dsDNA virus sp.]|nr:MAG: hypothetical protein Unbinned3138contig1000_17 [Prokaryotic dsDNA virus sp.]|tara:strand:+ start:2775 stop:3026 length:252 start_codon:yes stop_codon:yes gene_type:complete